VWLSGKAGVGSGTLLSRAATGFCLTDWKSYRKHATAESAQFLVISLRSVGQKSPTNCELVHTSYPGRIAGCVA
jgi:hypothetical protein